MITEDYVSYEVAKLLKEKGFDEKTLSYYEDNVLCHGDWFEWNRSPLGHIAAPTLQLAMKWLREEKRISIIIEFDLTKRGYCPYVHQLDYDMDWVVKWRVNTPIKYEKAVEVALKYSLENLI